MNDIERDSQIQPQSAERTDEATSTKSPQAALIPPTGDGTTDGGRGAVGAPLWPGFAALAVALALSVAGFFFWDRQHQILDSQSGLSARMDTRLGDVDNVINRVQSGFEQFKTGEDGRRLQLEGRLDQLEEAQRDQGQRLENLGRLIGRGSREWSVAQVEYLLTLANRSVQLARDVATARAALGFADDTLRALDDPAYLAVRQRISAEIAALDAVPAVDQTGLASSLDALMAQIDTLPMQGHPAAQAAAGTDTGTGEVAQPAVDWRHWSAWRQLPGVIWDAIQKLVRVREHDRPIEPMVAPAEEYFLKQNLRLQLESARLAVLRQAPLIYRQTLETARAWIADYFDTGDSGVAAVQERLTELASINIRPDLPDISGSLNALRDQAAMAPVASTDPGGSGRPAGKKPRADSPETAAGAADSTP